MNSCLLRYFFHPLKGLMMEKYVCHCCMWHEVLAFRMLLCLNYLDLNSKEYWLVFLKLAIYYCIYTDYMFNLIWKLNMTCLVWIRAYLDTMFLKQVKLLIHQFTAKKMYRLKTRIVWHIYYNYCYIYRTWLLFAVANRLSTSLRQSQGTPAAF